MSKELLLEVKNLNVSVEEKHILHDVNLEIGKQVQCMVNMQI